MYTAHLDRFCGNLLGCLSAAPLRTSNANFPSPSWNFVYRVYIRSNERLWYPSVIFSLHNDCKALSLLLSIHAHTLFSVDQARTALGSARAFNAENISFPFDKLLTVIRVPDYSIGIPHQKRYIFATTLIRESLIFKVVWPSIFSSEFYQILRSH